MATDNKQQLASDQQTVVKAQVGEGNQPNHRLRMPRLQKIYILYALLGIVVLLGLASIIKQELHIGEKVYAESAGHKIYKQDIDQLRGKTKNITDHQVATVLADQYLTEAMAKRADIKVTDKDVETQFGRDVIRQKEKNRYVYQSDVNTVYFNQLIAYNAGLYKGKLLVANFSRHIAFESPFLELQKASDPLMGNQAAVDADKKYAHDFIGKLYDQVKAGKISFDEAIKKERADPVLGLSAYRTLPHSGPFDTSNVYLGSTALVAPEAIKAKISGIKPGQLSTPFAVSVNNSLTQKKITTESYYLVVQMDVAKDSHSGLSYDQYLSKSKQQLGYKINV